MVVMKGTDILELQPIPRRIKLRNLPVEFRRPYENSDQLLHLPLIIQDLGLEIFIIFLRNRHVS